MAPPKAPLDAKITIISKSNPHKVGSLDAGRFDSLKPNMTVSAALAVGANWRYLLYAVKRKLISIPNLAEAPPTAPTETKPRPVTTGVAKPLPPSPKLWKGDPTKRVCLTYDERLLGTLVRQGPEQSEVKFDNGNTHIISNRTLRFIATGELVPGPAADPKPPFGQQQEAATPTPKKKAKVKRK